MPDDTPQLSKFAKPGQYTTKLPPEQELEFQKWVKLNRIPWQDSPASDYDMRGFWQAMQSGDPNAKRAENLHFPDTYKTPYHKTFSNESRYALPGAPHWEGEGDKAHLVPTSVPNDRYIALPDGRYLHLTGAETPQQLSALKDKLRGQTGESGLKTFGREAALGAFSGLGIAETQTPLKDTLKALMAPPDLKDPETYLGPAYGIAKGLFRSAADIAEGAGANAQKPSAFGPVDLAKLGHGLGSIGTQLLALKGGKKGAETPLAESEVVRGAKELPEIPRKVVQSATAAKYTVNKAERLANETNAAKLENFKSEVEQAKRVARSKYETEQSEAGKGLAKKVAEHEKRSIESSKQEGAIRSYEELKDRTAKEAADNLNKAANMEKMALDSEYEDFAAKVLGKDKAHPNGTLETDIAPVAQAVKNAETNILKGSEESIKQFRSITGRLGKDVVAGQGVGETAPAPTPIPADQLRGYVTELNEKIYDADVPGDVRAALKSVRDAAQKSVSGAIEAKFGKSAVKAYQELNARYSDYMETWRDTSSGSPLARVWKIMNQPMAAKRDIPVYREIADIFTGSKGEKTIPIIARKKAFGADPGLVAKLRQADEKLASLPKPKKVSEVAPRKPPFVAKIDLPKEPEIEPFNRQVAMRNALEDRINAGGRIGQLLKLLSIPADIAHGRFAPAASQAEQIMLIEAVRRALTSGKALDYLSKEKP